MTYEKALQSVLMYCTEECGKMDAYRCENKECVEAAVIKALKKQIPKKPIIIEETEDYFRHTLCPNCEKVDFGFTQPCFCDRCGQAIDWR